MSCPYYFILIAPKCLAQSHSPSRVSIKACGLHDQMQLSMKLIPETYWSDHTKRRYALLIGLNYCFLMMIRNSSPSRSYIKFKDPRSAEGDGETELKKSRFTVDRMSHSPQHLKQQKNRPNVLTLEINEDLQVLH